MAVDVLDDDDTVVDEHAEGEGKAEQHHRVERNAKQ